MEKPKKYEEHLMAAFAFDEDDLSANQAGQLSRRQIDHLRRQQRSAANIGAMLGLFDLLALAIILPALSSGGGLSATGLVISFVFAAMMAAACLYFMIRARRMTADARERRATEVEGRVDLAVSVGRNSASYAILVDKQRFLLKQAAFLAFKNGDPYRIYYAPRSKKILSVEWLRENDANLLEKDEIRADVDVDQGDEPTASQQRRRP